MRSRSAVIAAVLAFALSLTSCDGGDAMNDSAADGRGDVLCGAYQELVDAREAEASGVPIDRSRQELQSLQEREESALEAVAEAASGGLARDLRRELHLLRAVNRETRAAWGEDDGHEPREDAIEAGYSLIDAFLFPDGIEVEDEAEPVPRREFHRLADRNAQQLISLCESVPNLSISIAPPDVSPGRIVYVDVEDFTLRAADPSTGEELAFTQPDDVNATEPEFSPDGRLLAFIAYGGEDERRAKAWVAQPDGQDARPLTDDEREESCISWSAEGDKVVTSREAPDPPFRDELAFVSLEGTIEPIPEPDAAAETCAVPFDEDEVLLTRPGGDLGLPSIWWMRRDGSGLRPFADPETCVAVDPTPSPNRFRVGYLLSCFDPSKSGLYVANPDGTGVEQLIPGTVGAFDWSPDGRWIVFGYVEPGGDRERPALLVSRSDGSKIHHFADNGAFPTWGPPLDEAELAVDTDSATRVG